MSRMHRYRMTTIWIGNRGEGTRGYKNYDRNHIVRIEGKHDLNCSSDPAFRGDPTKYSPEELLVSSLSGCHMLWYLHLCAANGVIVTDYVDEATGTMRENPDGSGEFIEVILSPRVTVLESSMVEKATSLHHDANRMCFIARSMNFPVRHTPTTLIRDEVTQPK